MATVASRQLPVTDYQLPIINPLLYSLFFPMIDIPELYFEYSLWGCGVVYVAGLDEAGRGAWAGPGARRGP